MEAKLQAERREGTGKGVARKLRAAGRVPAVLYGHNQDSTPLSVDARELLHLFHKAASANVLVDLEVEGETHLVIPRDVQRNHIHNRFVHVDFLAVSRTEKITVSVEIIEVGDAPGVKLGGVIEHHLREVQVEAFPQDVPEHLDADISKLEIGDMVHVSDLAVPAGVTMMSNLEDAVLSVITPAALRTEAELLLPGEEAPEIEAPEAEAEAEAEVSEAAQEGGEG